MLNSLSFKNVLKIRGELLVGSLTHKQYHNKKYYACKTKNIQKVLELSLAWELYNMEVEDGIK
ncbi:hypothetical protein VPBG_00081 [Vibrio phage helene 12B3]|uniref:hypothetical protein n=1 Tax=Vibrio phage helene 12B3 TaxID=573173 RepID=UPI0002C07393|nr:hypothetical protein VPBG_00081 [Vibrio phage helene 12B3]AGG57853.1 hypothetical protein VPBG_00081 [Vibrio phage helene 12B3]